MTANFDRGFSSAGFARYVRRSLLLLAVVFLGATPSWSKASAGFDGAILYVVEPEVGRTVVDDIEERVVTLLSGSSAPRIMEPASVRRTLQDAEPTRLVARAESDINETRGRLAAGHSSFEMIDSLDGAREDLLRSLPTTPRLELIRESWALRGLAASLLEEPEAARRDYARVLESDPSFRPDPRVYPPRAREEIGRAMMARTDSVWRAFSNEDASLVARLLGVDFVVVAHLQDAGFVELLLRVDVYDLAAGHYVGEMEATFPDAQMERARVAEDIADLVSELVPRTGVRVAAGDSLGTGTQGAFEAGSIDSLSLRGDEASPGKGRSGRGWIVASVLVAVAAGGAAAYVGLTAEEGSADLIIYRHR